MHPTHNTLPEDTRSQVAETLNARLVDVSDLYFQAKTAHWNVKGPNFIALHKLFDDVAEAASEWTDLVAERVVQLGGTAEATVQLVAQRTSLEEYPTTLVDERDHVQAISSALARFAELAREGVEETEKLDDMGSSDMLVDIVREADKLLWFVEAHHSEEQFAQAPSRRAARAHSSRK
jgi:starvation-inducible DNA-binding protein